MDAYNLETAAQILTEFPELAEELIIPKEPLKIEDQLQCATKELSNHNTKSPINFRQKSNNHQSLNYDDNDYN